MTNVQGYQGNVTAPAAASSAATSVAREIVADSQKWFGRGPDTAEIADALVELKTTNPATASAVEAAVRSQLSVSQQQHLTTDLSTAQDRSNTRLMLDLTQMGLDVAGIVDPTGVADGANAAMSLGRGDLFGAGISLVGMIPYAGDTAKIAKFGKWADTVVSVAVRAASDPAFAKKALPILKRIGDGLDALPQGLIDKMPAGAKAQLEGMKEAIGKALGRGADDLLDTVAPRALFANADFASGKKFADHFAKHGAEFPSLDSAGYLDRARELLSAGGDNILEKIRPNGDVLRFDKETGDFAVGTADGQIRTLFKPDDGLDYFNKQ